MIRIAALALLFLWPGLAVPQNEGIVADLSQRRVSITTTFTGSEIIIFGAVKRETPAAANEPLDVIITVSGPSQAVSVRKKDRVAGIWVNTQEQEVDSAPSFYAIMTSGPLGEILSETEDLRHRITTTKLIRAVDGGAEADLEDFTEALIRIRKDEDVYQINEGAVAFFDETLFRSQVRLPANLIEGAYETRIFLTREKEIVSMFTTQIDVSKVGLERLLYRLAHDRPLLYGIMSLAIAIAAGWLASAAFRLLRT
ncbi:MAG: TIGR02186 family protein [Pseudomonadota bacterium]